MNFKLKNNIAEIAFKISQCADLSRLHVKFFHHDITFGDGAAALLGTNPDLTVHYHKNRIPFIYSR